ncbi:MAG: polyphosphate kinase 2 [Gammaproteobacteria bacterium]
MKKKDYEESLYELQIELNKLQRWVTETGARIVVIFEGRDAAGKGGTIRRIAESVSPRVFRTVALPKPSDRQKSQWYFQRYVEQLPAAGEVILFDRSWYNRAGVEVVMGFCTPKQRDDFLRDVPPFELTLVDDGIILVKYWLEVSSDEQQERFEKRIAEPTKQWKLSPMDLEARRRWYEYSLARDRMFDVTDTSHAPWYVVRADDKKEARLNCISHLLSVIPYEDLDGETIELPKRSNEHEYDDKATMTSRRYVPERY